MMSIVHRRLAALAAFVVALASFGYGFVGTASTAMADVTPLVDGAEFPNHGQQGGICPNGEDGWSTHLFESDSVSGEWGSAVWTAGDDAVTITVEDGHEVLVCTKGGNGRTIYRVTEGVDQTVPSPDGAGLSHWAYKSWAVTTTVTEATTTPGVPGPSCPPPPEGAIVLELDPEALRVRSDRAFEPDGHKQIPAASLTEGVYLLSLGSYDPSHFPVPPGDEQRQPYEQWLLEFRNGSGIIVESPATPDLADDEIFAYYPNVGTVVLGADATQIWIRHDRFTPEGVKLPSPSTANSVDPACAYLVPLLSGLGDFVWEDLDADGIQDEGEPGIGGATVNLWTAVDGSPAEQIATTTTDSDGAYEFTGLNPGDYIVQFETPDGFDPTLPNQGDDDSIDSDAVNGLSQVVPLGPDEFDPTIDAGFVRRQGPPTPEPGRIVVVKAFDVDADGIADDLPDGVLSPDFRFTPSWKDDFTLKVGESNDSGDLEPGTYAVAEDPAEFIEGEFRWKLVSSSCTDGSSPDSIDLDEGETVTCTFLNTRIRVQGQVTTTTTAPATTTTAPSTTTTPAVSPSTLPFTGAEDGSLIGTGVASVVLGLLLLFGARRREDGAV